MPIGRPRRHVLAVTRGQVCLPMAHRAFHGGGAVAVVTPRTTYCWCTWLSSPCRGALSGIWQFWQRGCCNTERTISKACVAALLDAGDCACAQMAGNKKRIADAPATP